ncbi:glycosyltransferase family 9 protein [Aquabacterium soli]|jgi:heptosyltransferase I|uniref:Glycosyltransferase family 9 protein n=1 Tax=Aquabacterium soli TaxID=2493092 RepID=A0A3R8YNI9_9BURK|nr:glycosyltransferase family 9 protein [Aquabacterium soli]RRS04481.1 glycosyltransferase family 9 protein [Aquabacterium soli]
MTSRDPQRILIIRLSALGDVVMASGLIPALRARYPHAALFWLNEGPGVPLLTHNPDLKGIILLPKERWKSLWKARQLRTLWQEVKAFRRQLREHRFDLALDTQGLLKSSLCAWWSGAPRRISIIGREGGHLLVHERIKPPAGQDTRMGSEYRFLASYLGARDEDFKPDLAIGEKPRSRMRQALAEARSRDSATRPMVMLCPFTTRPQKHWFEDRWVDLSRALYEHGWQPVILGGPADKAAAERIAQAHPQTLNMAGALKLDESTAAIAEGQLLIGVDTGLTHMGSALGIPTVALFGSTRPYLSSGQPSTRVMYDGLSCSPCRRNPTCNGRFDCMRQFTVERVLNTALDLIRNTKEGP